MHMTTEIYQISLVHKQHSSGKFKKFSGLDQPHLQMMFTEFICNVHNLPVILFSIQAFIGLHNPIPQYGNGTGGCYDRKDINSCYRLQSERQAGNDNQDNLIMHIDFLIFKKSSNCLHIKDGKSQLFACFTDSVYVQLGPLLGCFMSSQLEFQILCLSYIEIRLDENSATTWTCYVYPSM